MKSNQTRKLRRSTRKVKLSEIRAMIREIEAEIRAAEEAKNTPPFDTAIPYQETSGLMAEAEELIGDSKMPPTVAGCDDLGLTHGANWRN